MTPNVLAREVCPLLKQGEASWGKTDHELTKPRPMCGVYRQTPCGLGYRWTSQFALRARSELEGCISDVSGDRCQVHGWVGPPEGGDLRSEQGCEGKPAELMGGQWERGGMCRVRWRQQLTKITQLPGAVRQARVTIRAAEVRPAQGSHCDPEKSSSH